MDIKTETYTNQYHPERSEGSLVEHSNDTVSYCCRDPSQAQDDSLGSFLVLSARKGPGLLRTTTGRRSTLLGALSLALFLFTGSTAQAAEFIVDRVDDDAAVTQCDPGINLDCTLRGAIIAANLTPGPPHTVTIPAGTFVLTISGEDEDSALTGDLDLLVDMIVQGAGESSTVIDGGGYPNGLIDRLFHIVVGESTLTDLTIRGGAISLGGGLRIDQGTDVTVERVKVTQNRADGAGGIFSEGTLTLIDSTVLDNEALASAGGIASRGPFEMTSSRVVANLAGSSVGGLVQMAGSAIISDSVFRNNEASDGTGGGIGVGFAATAAASISLTRCLVESNRALGVDGFAGGIWVDPDGALTVLESTFHANQAAQSGGALFVSSLASEMVIDDSLFKNNQAESNGGGIAFEGEIPGFVRGSTFLGNQAEFGGGMSVASSGEIFITNSTFSGNTAINNSGDSSGGGLYNRGDLELESCTLVGNSAASAPAIDSGAIILYTNNVIEGGCGMLPGERPFGGPISHGGNVESPGDSCSLYSTTDTVNVPDLELGPLADFGGPTPTHLPYPTSPVIGGGNDLLCIATDQRGAARVDGDCDSGAVERQPEDPDDPTLAFVDGFETGDTSQWSQTVP